MPMGAALISSAVVVALAVVAGAWKLGANMSRLEAGVSALRTEVEALRAEIHGMADQWRDAIKQAIRRHVRRYHPEARLTGEIRRTDD